MKLVKLIGPTETPVADMLANYIEVTTFIEFQWYGTKLQYFGDYVIKPSGFKYLSATEFGTNYTVTDANDDVFTFFAVIER